MRSRLSENGSVKTDLCKDNRGDGDLQSLWPASSDVSRLAYCCCIAVIACGIGLFHMARASSRLTPVHVNTSQNNSGCEVLQRVHRPAGRSHMLKMCIRLHISRRLQWIVIDFKRNLQQDKGHCTKNKIVGAHLTSPRTLNSGAHLFASLEKTTCRHCSILKSLMS